MARLPSRDQLGGIPLEQTKRVYSGDGIRVPSPAPANPMGEAIAGIGKQLSLVGRDLQDQQDQYEYANAHADLMKRAIEQDTKYLNDTDYQTRTQRYSDELDEFVQNRAETISNPRIKMRFLANAGQVHASHTYKQTAEAIRQGNSDALTKLDQEGQFYLDSAIAQPTDKLHESALAGDRQQAIEGYNARVDALVSSRALTPVQGTAAKRKFSKAYHNVILNGIIDKSEYGDGVLDKLENDVRTAPPLTEGVAPPSLKESIKTFEGYTPKAQWDYKQHSIGYGTRAKYAGEVIDRDTAEARLDEELQKASDFVDKVNPDLPPGVKAALTSLTYNAGGAWANAGLGESIRNGDFEKAKRQFVSYNQAGGKTLDALVKRRNEEVTWFDQPERFQLAQAEGSPTIGEANSFSRLGATERQALLERIEKTRRRQEADNVRANVLLEKQQKEETANEEIRLLQSLSDPEKRGQVSHKSIANNPVFSRSGDHGRAAIERMQGILERDGRRDKYGDQFFDLWKRVFAPDGDPSKITDPQALSAHVDSDGKGLTVAGYNELYRHMTNKSASPEAAALPKLLDSYFKKAEAALVKVDPYGIVKDPKGAQAHMEFMTQSLPEFYRRAAKGDSPTAIFKDFDERLEKIKRTPEQVYSDMAAANPKDGDLERAMTAGTATEAQVQSAVRAGKLPPEKAYEYGIKRNWFGANPTVSVPVSQ